MTAMLAPDRVAEKPLVLVLLSHYLPGYKAGGPIRSIANMVEALGDELDFQIVTNNRDLGESKPFPEISPYKWTRAGKARVFYVPDSWRSMPAIVRILMTTSADLLYLNSFFARRFSIIAMLLRRLRIFRPKAILLAPRGEFSTGALEIKKWRKRAYIALARKTGLYANVLWHASSPFEEADIHNAFCNGESIAVAGPIASHSADAARKLRIVTAPDMPGTAGGKAGSAARHKPAGSIRLVFLSRISRKKNLDTAIAMLEQLTGQVQFDIYGPIEDPAYWKKCLGKMAGLPPHIQVHYRGEAHHDMVHRVLSEYDALLFPTRGENYGHVIREAFSAGCPVIISDQTPWRGLEPLGVGWDLPLESPERFRRAIQSCIEMAPETFAEMAARVYDYGTNLAKDPEIVRQNQSLFARALGRDIVRELCEAGDCR